MQEYIACGIYIMFVLGVVEYIYRYRYIPNLRRMAERGYIDW
jgi:hypothetical protein